MQDTILKGVRLAQHIDDPEPDHDEDHEQDEGADRAAAAPPIVAVSVRIKIPGQKEVNDEPGKFPKQAAKFLAES